MRTRTGSPGRRFFDRWLWIGLAVVALFLLLALQPMAPRRVDVGSAAAEPSLSGFSFPETGPGGQAFRWSTAEGTVRFFDLSNRPLRARILLHASRPDAPPIVKVRANEREVASFPASGEFAEYTVEIDRRAAGWDGTLDLTLQVAPFTAPPDTRALGAAVAWVEVTPGSGPALPNIPTLCGVILPALLAAAALTWWARRLGASGLAGAAIASAYGAAIAVLLWKGPLWLPGAGWACAATLWLGALTMAWGPRAARWIVRRARAVFSNRSVRWWLIAIAIVALVIYVPLSLTKGYEGDIEIYMAWTYQITHNGIHSVYSPDFVAPPNTTPGLMYPFRVAGELFRIFFSPEFPPTWIDETNQAYLRFLLRLPALLCTAAIAAVAFWWGRSQAREGAAASGAPGADGVQPVPARGIGAGDRWALILVAAYVFNPAVIFEAAYYGQTGAVHSLFMLLAVVAMVKRKPAWGWAALTAGMLTKPQADLFLPLFAIVTLRQHGVRGLLRSVGAAVAVALLMLSPFILHGTLGEMWMRVRNPAAYHPVLSATAHNIWWLFSGGAAGMTSDLLAPAFLQGLGLSALNYRMIGLSLVGIAYLMVILRTWRDRSPRTLFLSTAYLFLAFFMLATQIHENHLIPMFSLLLLACSPRDRKTWALYWLLAATTTLNMALHYPAILRVLAPQNPDVWAGAEMALPRLLNSAAQVGVFAYWTLDFARRAWAGLPIRKSQ